jgi:hypothetical protein
MLCARRPQVIFLMQPPVVALWVVGCYAAFARVPIVADLHTGVFNDPKWSWSARMVLWQVRRQGLALVHTDSFARLAERHKCPTLVLHNRVEPLPVVTTSFVNKQLADIAHPFVLVPLSYASDEPIAELLAAAARTPQIRWVFTGDAPQEVRAAATENVVFPGYMENEDYIRMFTGADCILSVTTKPETMQQVAYEALNASSSLVVSDTTALRAYFKDAAYYCQPTGADIAHQVVAAIGDPDLATRMLALHEKRIVEQVTDYARLTEWIKAHV